MNFLVALTVTHRRPQELKRLLDSLEASTMPPDLCVISDHAPDGTTARLAAESRLKIRVLEDTSNPGPGAGWSNAAAGLEEADLLFLDDDVVLPPDGIAKMRGLLSSTGAVAPLLADAGGLLWAFPEPALRDQRKIIRQAKTPADALALLGPGPHPFCWCTGACVLVSANLYRSIGPHRRDFWMLGEDLEFSMRAAMTGKAVFTCEVIVPHLPPVGPASATSGYIKFCSLLQNLSYLSFHSPHRQHMTRYLPGNFLRFFRTHSWRPGTLRDAWACFSGGALHAEPAGDVRGTALRKRITEHAR
ncbi:MAG: glycosyltransferase [Terrimicrobiaceae bacterium]